MVDEQDLYRERIQILRTYIQLLEKVKGTFVGLGLNKAEQAVLAAIERRLGWQVQVLAVIVGVGIFAIGLGAGRVVARSLTVLLALITSAALLGLYAVVAIFRQARQRIVEYEIRVAQLKIFHLEDQLAERNAPQGH